ncbi:MAG: flagellar filament capping protein FliD [Salinisphaeraceae bacterium]|nr:flagellar filament capping protein FliD [Salinisphaeraceae bacterium]
MPTISALGIGSGLDIASLVEQLVTAETSAKTLSLVRRESETQAKISAFGTLQGALSALQSKVNNLDTGELEKRSASSSNEDVFTATALSTAALSQHSIEVEQLAQAHRLASGSYASPDTEVGTGTLTIEVGGNSFDVVIDSENNTVSGIMDAINDAEENTGVSASLITAGGVARLVLTSEESGAANSLRITQSGGDGGLASLVYDPGVDEQLSELDAALDSRIYVDGFLHTASTNNIDDALPGVTLNLKSEDPGTQHNLDVNLDVSTQRAAIEGFVQAFNAAIASISTVSSYNSETNTASALTGDSTVRQLSISLRSALSSISPGLAGQLASLSEIGITVQVDGSLSIDQSKLDQALETQPERVQALLTGASGLTAQLSTVLSQYLDSDGRITNAMANLDSQLDDIEDDNLRLQDRAASLEERYRRQFTALDTLIAQMNSTSEFLTNQLSQLPNLTLDR